jgi:cytochrome c oxidase subunit 2
MRVRVLTFIFAACALTMAGEGHASWQSALDVHGAPADGLAWLIYLFFAVCGTVWLLVVGALALVLLRRRDRGATPGRSGVQKRLATVVSLAVAMTVMTISGLTYASYRATRDLSPVGEEPLVISMRGHQWWWEAIYGEEQGTRTFSTANELHVPVGREIRIKLGAVDVIHSFWVPSLAGKVDMIPGRENEISFTVQRAGVYRGQCAEFCGIQHAHMGFLVVAEDADAFYAWRRGQMVAAAEPSDDEQRRGRDVFLTRQCAACHSVRGTSAKGVVGPDLTHVGGRRTIAAGLLPTTRGSLAAWTADPQTLKPGNNMPTVPLSADDLKAVSAWMAGLR